MTEENHEKTPVRLDDTGIRTRDLPNASLVRYHGATSLVFFLIQTHYAQNNVFIVTSILEVIVHVLKFQQENYECYFP